jgi:membrane dipeptidase
MMTATNGLPIFDGHNDTLLSLYTGERGEGATFFERSDKGHIDLPRARAGGFGGGFFAVYVPPEEKPDHTDRSQFDTDDGFAVPLPPLLEHGYAQRVAIAVSASLFRIEAASDGQLKVVRTADELAGCLRDGVIAAILHFEGAEAIDPELHALEVFYQAGLRSLGPVWSRNNIFGHGVPFSYPMSPDTGPGLTDAGKRLVKECNRLGIMIDLAHITEKGFWDVAELSEQPLVVSHSNAHAITPVARNLTDKQLGAVRESKGLVGLNFAVGMLRPDGQEDANTPIQDMIRHIDHLVERVGIDGVAIGSDFDGATVPAEIGDAAGLQKLVEGLQNAGYGERDLAKICRENWLRVLVSAWHETAAA